MNLSSGSVIFLDFQMRYYLTIQLKGLQKCETSKLYVTLIKKDQTCSIMVKGRFQNTHPILKKLLMISYMKNMIFKLCHPVFVTFQVAYKKEKVVESTGDLSWISSATNNRATGEIHHSAAVAPESSSSVDKILDSLASVKNSSNNDDNKHIAWIEQV